MPTTWAAARDVLDSVLAEFGGAVLYIPRTGPAVSITAVFDETAREQASGGEGHALATSTPTLLVDSGSLALPPSRGDKFIIGGVTYVVQTHEPNGSGGYELRAVRQ